MKKPNEVPQFDPKTRNFNSRINALAVIQLAKQSLTTMSLKEKKRFFSDVYKIGLETLAWLCTVGNLNRRMKK